MNSESPSPTTHSNPNPGAYEHDIIWKQGLWRCDQGKMRLYSLNIIDGFYDFKENTVTKAILPSTNWYKQELGSYSNSSEL